MSSKKQPVIDTIRQFSYTSQQFLDNQQIIAQILSQQDTKYTIQDVAELIKRFNIREKNKTISNIKGISSRIANYWAQSGLINSDAQQYAKGWRKFSTVDEIFMKIAQELRKFGFSLDKIRTTKESLEESVIKNQMGKEVLKTPVSVLEAAIIAAADNNSTLYILADETGKASFFTKDILVKQTETDSLPCCCICLNFTNLVNNTDIVSKVFTEIQPNSQNAELAPNERRIIQTLNQPDVEKISVKKDLNTKKAVRMEVIKEAQKGEQPHIAFGEIQTKIHNGKEIRRRVVETIKLS